VNEQCIEQQSALPIAPPVYAPRPAKCVASVEPRTRVRTNQKLLHEPCSYFGRAYPNYASEHGTVLVDRQVYGCHSEYTGLRRSPLREIATLAMEAVALVIACVRRVFV